MKKNHPSSGGKVGSESHKKQALRYYEGNPESGKNKEFLPKDVASPNDLGEVIDQTRKKPYGVNGMDWGTNTGKLGDLDPKETDQPAWINTWSKLNTGPYGAGVTIDENYGVERPRTQTRQANRFAECNPEFQDVADEGDWTSWEWNSNV